jgi:hypothetical protein
MLVYSFRSGPEDEVPAVVIGVRILDGEEDRPARGDGLPGAGHVARDDVLGFRRIRDVETVIPRVARAEREPEKPALAAVVDVFPEIEEDSPVPADDPQDPSRLLHDVQDLRLAGGVRQQDR